MPPNSQLIADYSLPITVRTGIGKPFSSLATGLVLLLTVVLPPLGHLAFGTSSMAVGVFFVSGLYIFMYIVSCAIHRQSQNLKASVFLVSVVLGVVIAHDVISFLLNDDFDYYRFWQTYLLLIFFLFGATFFVLLSHRLSDFHADYAVKLVFYVLLLSGVAGILNFSPFVPEAGGRSVLFFSEPSHFALSFLPFLLYMTVTANEKMKLLLILVGYATGLLLQNMTMVVGVILISVLVVPIKTFLLLTPVALLPFYFTDMNIGYYSSRLVLSIHSQNLSAMVHLSGLERAYLNFKETLGLGVGFQQFGIIGSRGEAMYFVEKLAGMESNLLDGGTMVSKFVGEFGFLGVIMLLVYLVYFVKIAIWLNKVSVSNMASHYYKGIFFLSCFIMYCMDLFVRGTGYFSPTGFLFVTSLIWIKRSKSPNSGDSFGQCRRIYT